MKQFHIFHSTGTDRFQEIDIQPRVYAGFVQADSIEEAYMLSQNGDDGDEWNATNPCRSTSVGDVIQDSDTFYMVCGRGFKPLEEELSEADYWNGDESDRFAQ